MKYGMPGQNTTAATREDYQSSFSDLGDLCREYFECGNQFTGNYVWKEHIYKGYGTKYIQ